MVLERPDPVAGAGVGGAARDVEVAGREPEEREGDREDGGLTAFHGRANIARVRAGTRRTRARQPGRPDLPVRREPMLWLLASIMLLAWIVLLAFKITAGAIHILLVAALALYVFSAIRGRRAHGTVP